MMKLLLAIQTLHSVSHLLISFESFETVILNKGTTILNLLTLPESTTLLSFSFVEEKKLRFSRKRKEELDSLLDSNPAPID